MKVISYYIVRVDYEEEKKVAVQGGMNKLLEWLTRKIRKDINVLVIEKISKEEYLK